MKKITINFNRANLIESSHQIKILVKNTKGKTLITSGNNNDYIYPRSSIKIFQAIPFMHSNAVKHFKLNSKMIALACSSHRGEYFHIKELKKWINKINVSEKVLQCGIHYPLNLVATEKILRKNIRVNQLYNNCAGKHLAMISGSLKNKYNINNYLKFNHKYQKEIRNVFEKFSNIKIKKKNYGVDGCSAPQYSFKIKDINKMLVNLIKSYNGIFYYHNEVTHLIDSIINYPNYIGGTDSLDSKIMMISDNKIFCKGGAEGVFLFTDFKKGIAGVIKVIDGNERAIPPLIYNLFKKLKLFNYGELQKFSKLYKFKLINHAKINIGSIETII